MIIVAGGTKGGSGQTTVATNLAIMRAASGRDVLLMRIGKSIGCIFGKL